jgi:hypothetical protein
VKEEKKIVAYAAKRKALTIKEYRMEIEESISQYKRSKVITQKEMENFFESI